MDYPERNNEQRKIYSRKKTKKTKRLGKRLENPIVICQLLSIKLLAKTAGLIVRRL